MYHFLWHLDEAPRERHVVGLVIAFVVPLLERGFLPLVEVRLVLVRNQGDSTDAGYTCIEIND